MCILVPIPTQYPVRKSRPGPNKIHPISGDTLINLTVTFGLYQISKAKTNLRRL